MMRWLAVVSLAAGTAAAWPRLPAAQGVASPIDAFSAARAMEHVRRWAVEPRPSGSAEHRRVLRAVEGELIAAGLPVVRMSGSGLVNLVAGSATEEGVWLAAHSDSVPAGPGAADDGLGLAVVTEAARALAVGGVPPDLHVLITDGEEQGLLGAELFARNKPQSGRIFLNVEARGTEGPAFMFQQAGPEGELMDAFSAAGCMAQTSSLATAVYRLLPNDTDFTVFSAAGWWGYDFALIGGAQRYHTAEDTPDNLDPRSVQQMGDCVVAIAREWLGRPLVGEASDQSWFRGPGGVWMCPSWLVRTSSLSILLFPRPSHWRGVVAWVAALAAAVACGFGLFALAPVLRPDFWERPAEMTRAEPWYFAALVLGVGLAVLAAGGRRVEGFLLATGIFGSFLALIAPDVGYMWAPGVVAAAALQRESPSWKWRGLLCAAAFASGVTTGPFLAAIFPALTTRALPFLVATPFLTLGWAFSRRPLRP